MCRLVAIVAVLLGTLVSPAHAEDERVEVAEDGTVRITREVPLPRSALLQVLVDPALASVLAPDVLSKERLTEGACPVYRVATKGIFRPFVYDFTSCTTDSGVTEELVASEDFLAFSSRWHLEDRPGGTRIRYELLVEPRLKVPGGLVRLSQRRSMRATMRRLIKQAEMLLRPKASTP